MLGLSLQLCIMASLIATAFALPLGALAALKQDTWVDYVIRLFSIAGLAMPGFWVGILTILGLLYFFHYLPPLTFKPLWESPGENLANLTREFSHRLVDYPLTEKGVLQAEQTAEHLKNKGISAIFCRGC